MCCHCLNRREFLGATAASVAGASLALSSKTLGNPNVEWDPEKPLKVTGKQIRIQPILTYSLHERQQQTSWRPWGGLHSEEDVTKEMNRINGELAKLKKKAEYPLRILPLIKVQTVEDAIRVRDSKKSDVRLIYAASGGSDLLEGCVSEKKDNIIFVRHRSGPVYLWYEIVHCRFLRKGGDGYLLDKFRNPGNTTIYDVVVDNYEDLDCKLRALSGVKSFLGKRIVALGGGGGWCYAQAPQIAHDKFKIDIQDFNYEDIGLRIKAAKADHRLVEKAEKWTSTYLSLPQTTLETDRQYVINAFLLYSVFKDLIHEHNTDSFTIKQCMGTIMPISETTACLPLSLLNDEGLLAFCESDFNVIPAGILLHHISGKPVFLNDPTYPHHGCVTAAHCTAPRRMDGKNYALARVVTHFESDYGATPKVELPRGTEVTMVCPDSLQQEWVGFKGTVVDSPFYDICRSQYDVEIQGNWKKLLSDMRGFHWMMAVGDYVDEMEYACRKIGINWNNISIV